MPKSKFICAICEKECETKQSVLKHLKSKCHEDDLKTLKSAVADLFYESQSEICEKSYYDKNNLMKEN